MITIHYDFTDGTEISYVEGLEKGDNFSTHCLDFFCFDTKVDDVRIIDKEGNSLYRNALLSNNTYTYKEIKKGHNLVKLLKAGTFNWRKTTVQYKETLCK